MAGSHVAARAIGSASSTPRLQGFKKEMQTCCAATKRASLVDEVRRQGWQFEKSPTGSTESTQRVVHGVGHI